MISGDITEKREGWGKNSLPLSVAGKSRICGFIADLYNKYAWKIYTKQYLETIYGIQMSFLCHIALLRMLPEYFRKRDDVSLFY